MCKSIENIMTTLVDLFYFRFWL